jgi:hypothetical protein
MRTANSSWRCKKWVIIIKETGSCCTWTIVNHYICALNVNPGSYIGSFLFTYLLWRHFWTCKHIQHLTFSRILPP